MNNWKKFTEEKPEIGKDIIFHAATGKARVGEFQGSGERVYGYTGYKVNDGLSTFILTDKYFWMYVPEVPEK